MNFAMRQDPSVSEAFPRHTAFEESDFSPIPGAVPHRMPAAAGGALPSRRPPFLTPERVATRHATLIDAFETADRRQRGYLPYDKCLEIYGLYFNATVGTLNDNEFSGFAEQFMSHTPTDGTLVVDYVKLADALRKRDLDMMNKAAAGALRQSVLSYASPERQPASHLHGSPDGMPAYRTGRSGKPSPRTNAPFATYSEPPPPPPPPQQHDAYAEGGGALSPAHHSPALSPSERRRGGGERGAGFAAVPYGGTTDPYGWAATGQHIAQHEYAPVAAAAPHAAAASRAPDSLRELLHILEAADTERSGRLHSAQLLTSCRMHGLEEASSLLRAVMQQTAADDGRVEYVAFVQQLAAQRAGEIARAQFAAPSS